MHKNIRSGFTLLELLIVVVIIAVLAGISVPVGRSLLGKSREAACLGNLRDLGVGLQLYLQDNNQMLPTLALASEGEDSDMPVLETILLPYLVEKNIFHCPADKKEFEETGSSYSWNTTQNGLHITKVSFFGNDSRPESVPLIFDKEAWHPSGTNFLYADSSASNKARFATGSKD